MADEIKEVRLFDGTIILKNEREAYYQLIDSLDCVVAHTDEDDRHGKLFAKALLGEAMARTALEAKLAEAREHEDQNLEFHEKVRAEVEKIAGEKQPIDLYSLACDAVRIVAALRAEIQRLEASMLDADNTARIQIERAEDLQDQIERKDAALLEMRRRFACLHEFKVGRSRRLREVARIVGLCDAALSSGEGEGEAAPRFGGGGSTQGDGVAEADSLQ